MGCAYYTKSDNSGSDNTITIICAVVIPCVVIAIGLAVWAILFYKKTHKMIKNEENVCEPD